MSPLTKLFVVLLVILSLVNTAATVVFVNQVDNANQALAMTKIKLSAKELEATQAQEAASAALYTAQQAVASAQQQQEQSRQAMTAVQQHSNELATKNAEQGTQLALGSANETRLTEALNASQQSGAKKDEAIVSLRQTNDERLKQNVELNTANTDLTAKLEVTERERQYMAEQLAEAKSTVDKQGAMMKDVGLVPTYAKAAGTSAGAPAINGVIRARRAINRIPYASISVGSNDGVTKGMEFKVVNRDTGDFLGILTVDSVEATESTGRLAGPRLGDIKPGVDVHTQL